MQPVHLIGAPLDLGGGRRGVDMGPSALRIAGLGEQIAALGRATMDRGNVAAPIRELAREGDVRKKYIEDIAAVCRRVQAMARKPLPARKSPGSALSRCSMAATRAWWPTANCGL